MTGPGTGALRRAATVALAVAALAGVAFAFPRAAHLLGWPWNRMRTQVVARPQERPPRPAPEGTVPFTAARWAHSPGATPANLLPTGADTFARNCAFCHGQKGDGTGPIADKLKRRPTDLTGWPIQARRDEDLLHVLASPAGVMPPVGERLTATERRRAIQYVRDTFAPHGPPPWAGKRDAPPAQAGKALYDALGCARCHERRVFSEGPDIPPSLENAGSKLQREWVAHFLLAPHRIRWVSYGKRPRLWMPAYRLEQWQADALAAYLMTRTNAKKFPPEALQGPGDAEETGRSLFEGYQCTACHRFGDRGRPFGPDLTHVGSRLQAPYMFQLLKDPQAVIPNTEMPSFDLWDGEARELVRFLKAQQ